MKVRMRVDGVPGWLTIIESETLDVLAVDWECECGMNRIANHWTNDSSAQLKTDLWVITNFFDEPKRDLFFNANIMDTDSNCHCRDKMKIERIFLEAR